jgi:hypothetical protein
VLISDPCKSITIRRLRYDPPPDTFPFIFSLVNVLANAAGPIGVYAFRNPVPVAELICATPADGVPPSFEQITKAGLIELVEL